MPDTRDSVSGEPPDSGPPGSEPPATGPRDAAARAEVLPATAGPRSGPRGAVTVRSRGALPQVRERLAGLARNPVAVTTALVGAGLAVRLGPAALGRDLLTRAASGPAAPAPVAPTAPAVVHHVVHVVHHVVVHVRQAPPPPPSIL